MNDSAPLSLQARKAKLIAQGDAFRIALIRAKSQTAQSLRPQALLHEGIEHAYKFAAARLARASGLKKLGLQTLMPYLITTFMTRKHLLKPVLGIGMASAVVYLLRRKQR